MKVRRVPLPELKRLGVKNDRRFWSNIARLVERGKSAKAAGFLIEAIAVRAYLFELLLQVWLVKQGKHVSQRATLGELIKVAQRAKLDSRLVGRLQRFNDDRNTAIHRLLRGQALYSDLRTALTTDGGLLGDFAESVFPNPP